MQPPNLGLIAYKAVNYINPFPYPNLNLGYFFHSSTKHTKKNIIALINTITVLKVNIPVKTLNNIHKTR